MAAFLLSRNKLYDSHWMLWLLMLSAPLPYIANTAGWMTAELGRQPWLIHGLLRTAHGASPRVAEGSVWFTLLGFMGLYVILSILWLFLVYREIDHGPESEVNLPADAASPAAVD
jgi:cytochrome d ubiquinol oxidase subunit I